MKADDKNTIYNFSYIRAIACLAIILLHTVFVALGLFGDTLSSSQQISYRVVTNNLMWAVPCFLMVTGALLLDRKRKVSYEKLFTKYILRVFLALLIFGLLFSVIDTFFGPDGPGIKIFFEQIYEVFTGNSWSHIWYLYCLIGLYLLLPIYKKVVDAGSQSDLKYLLVIYLIFLSLIPLLKIWNIECGFYIHVSSIYPFYFFAGYFLWEKFKGNGRVGWSVILLAASTIILTIISIIRWKNGSENLDAFFGYSSILVIAQACGFYGLIVSIKMTGTSFAGKLLKKFDENSFGVYLIHMILVRGLFKRIQLNPFNHGKWFCIILIVIITALISWGLTWALKKIPLFRKIL